MSTAYDEDHQGEPVGDDGLTEDHQGEPVGDDGLTDAEREQYAAQWRNGSGSRTLVLPPEYRVQLHSGQPDTRLLRRDPAKGAEP